MPSDQISAIFKSSWLARVNRPVWISGAMYTRVPRHISSVLNFKMDWVCALKIYSVQNHILCTQVGLSVRIIELQRVPKKSGVQLQISIIHRWLDRLKWLIFKKYKTFSVLIYSYINKSGNWKNEKLCGNTTPAGRSVFTQFRVFPIFTSVDITVYQYGKNVLYFFYNIAQRTLTEEWREIFRVDIELYQHSS